MHTYFVKHIATLSLIFLVNIGFSQEPVFDWGTGNTKAHPNAELKVLAASDAYYIINALPIKAGEFNSHIVLEKYGLDNSIEYRTDITSAGKYDFLGAYLIAGKLYVFNALYIKEKGQYILSATEINASNGSKGTETPIISMEAEGLSSRGSFLVAQSPDKKALVVLYQPSFKKNENEKITVTVVNSSLKQVWSSTQAFNYEAARYASNLPSINNAGTVFILKKTNTKSTTTPYSIFSIANNQPLKEFKLELGGKKKIVNIKTTFAPNGDFLTAGHYTEDASVTLGGTKFEGYFIYKMNQAGTEKIFGNDYMFDERKKDLQLSYILADDQRTYLVSEKKWETSVDRARSNNSPSQLMLEPERDITNYSSDIFINAINAKGDTLFNHSTKRLIYTMNNFGVTNGTMAILQNGKLFLLYNDDASKHDGKKRLIVVGGKKIPVVTIIDAATGKVEQNYGLDAYGNTSGLLIRPDFIFELPSNQYMIRAENESLFKMGRLTFKQ